MANELSKLSIQFHLGAPKGDPAPAIDPSALGQSLPQMFPGWSPVRPDPNTAVGPYPQTTSSPYAGGAPIQAPNPALAGQGGYAPPSPSNPDPFAYQQQQPKKPSPLALALGGLLGAALGGGRGAMAGLGGAARGYSDYRNNLIEQQQKQSQIVSQREYQRRLGESSMMNSQTQAIQPLQDRYSDRDKSYYLWYFNHQAWLDGLKNLNGMLAKAGRGTFDVDAMEKEFATMKAGGHTPAATTLPAGTLDTAALPPSAGASATPTPDTTTGGGYDINQFLQGPGPPRSIDRGAGKGDPQEPAAPPAPQNPAAGNDTAPAGPDTRSSAPQLNLPPGVSLNPDGSLQTPAGKIDTPPAVKDVLAHRPTADYEHWVSQGFTPGAAAEMTNAHTDTLIKAATAQLAAAGFPAEIVQSFATSHELGTRANQEAAQAKAIPVEAKAAETSAEAQKTAAGTGIEDARTRRVTALVAGLDAADAADFAALDRDAQTVSGDRDRYQRGVDNLTVAADRSGKDSWDIHPSISLSTPGMAGIPGTAGTPGAPAVPMMTPQGIPIQGSQQSPAIPGTPGTPGVPGSAGFMGMAQVGGVGGGSAQGIGVNRTNANEGGTSGKDIRTWKEYSHPTYAHAILQRIQDRQLQRQRLYDSSSNTDFYANPAERRRIEAPVSPQDMHRMSVDIRNGNYPKNFQALQQKGNEAALERYVYIHDRVQAQIIQNEGKKAHANAAPTTRQLTGSSPQTGPQPPAKAPSAAPRPTPTGVGTGIPNPGGTGIGQGMSQGTGQTGVPTPTPSQAPYNPMWNPQDANDWILRHLGLR